MPCISSLNSDIKGQSITYILLSALLVQDPELIRNFSFEHPLSIHTGQSLPPNATSPSSAQIGDVVYILGGRATDSNRIPRAGCDGQIRWLDLKAEQPEWKRANVSSLSR